MFIVSFLLLLSLSSVVFSQTAFNNPGSASPNPIAVPSALPVQGLPSFSPPVDFSFSPESLGPLFNEAKHALKGELNCIVSIRARDRTFKNTVQALETALSRFSEKLTAPSLMVSVSPDETLRDASSTLNEQKGELLSQISTRVDLYRAVKEYAAKGDRLEGEDKRLLDKILRDFKRKGMELSLNRRRKLKTIERRISDMIGTFSWNLQEYNDGLIVTASQLDELPEYYARQLYPLGRGRFLVTLKDSAFDWLMEFSRDSDLRRRMTKMNENRAAKPNVHILRKIFKLRHKKAQQLGYKSYADYAFEEHMEKSPSRVQGFLEKLKRILKENARKDIRELLKMKRKEEPGAKVLNREDLSYYSNKLAQERFLDTEEISKYFPLSSVVAGTIRVCERRFRIRFIEMEAHAWHEDVRLFEIRDAGSDKRLGHIYLDLYRREGKTENRTTISIIEGRELEEGGYREPVTAIATGFPKPSDDELSLLDPQEMKTLFHEFKHAIHQTLSRARYGSFSGLRVASDIAEGPPMVMENLLWRPEILREISGHYEDPSRKIPQYLIDKLIAVKKSQSAIDMLYQVALSVIDLAYHTVVPKDTTAVVKEAFRIFKELGFEMMIPGTHPEASFNHIVEGYGAGYSSYLLSKALAKDISSRLEKEGVISPAAWMDYRRKILEKGASVDEREMLRDFLGREPSEEPFFRSLGLNYSSSPD